MLNNAKVDGYELKLTNTDMKKYLFIALALFGMASCAKDDVTGGNKPHHNGEVEESYIAINLMAADVDSRAAADEYGYDQGTADERVINTAYFFFFDAQGNPFYVNTTNTPATQPGATNQTNHLSLSISEVGDPATNLPNVSDIKKAVLILETYKGVYPSQIVAVINWVPTANAYTLEQLREALVGLRDTGNGTNGFVMSNSVYMDGAGKIVDAVPLTAANIKTDAEEAKAAPVEIYVERVAAKVVLTASGRVTGTTNIFETHKNTTPVVSAGESSEIDVYVQLHGWELYNDNNQSYLLKNIDTEWNVTNMGLTWNDIPYYRSYWADTESRTESDTFSWSYATDKYPTAYGFKVAEPLSKNGDAYTYTEGTYTYCGENTGASTIDGEGKVTPYDKNTKVILKGQLMQKNGDNYEPLELARWYGTEYAGEEALRIAVANSLKYTLFSSSDGTNFDSIKPADLICVDGADVGAEAYEVGFQLSSTTDFGENKTWYQYDSTKGYVLFGTASDHDSNTNATNTYLNSVQPALLYKTGQTYYIVDIEHLGTKTAKYGVVRNHVYQIDINSITGYGSPVYTGTSDIINPEYPEVEDESSYVAAKINVLSWKVVKQGVNIVQ